MDAPAEFTDPDDARAYLSSLSSHVFRLGDTSFLHPDFAVRMANAVKQARSQGLPVTIQSGYRTNLATGSAYDAGGYSMHGYGAATDVGGIGGPGSPQAQQWASIAAQNGVYNPYGVNDPREFNHWQLVPYKLEQRPDIQSSIINAHGDINKIWNAISPVSDSVSSYSGQPQGGTGLPAQFSLTEDKPQPKGKAQAYDPFKEYPTEAPPSAPAKVSSAPAPAPAPAALAGSAPAADYDPFKEYPTSGGAPAIPPPSPASTTPQAIAASPSKVTPGTVSQDGLVWDANGGHDPQTDSLVVAGKPFTPPNSSTALAASSSFVSGVPVIGPYLESGVEGVAAGVNALRTGAPFSQNYSAARTNALQSQADNPGLSTGAGAAGGIAGTIPAMMAAPAAFGLGGGPLLARSFMSGVTGAGLGGADAFVRSGFSPSNAFNGLPYGGGDPSAALRGAEVGGVLGGIAPAAGQLIGAGVNRLSNALNSTTPAARNIAGVLSEIGMTPQGARNALDRIGPQATLADIDPALTTEAGGLASLGGEPTSILRNAMRERAAQADNRVAQAISSRLGPRPDLTAVKEGIVEDAGNAAGPYYDMARHAPQPMDVTSVLNSIDSQLKNAVGGEAAVLSKAKGYLTDQKVGMPGPNGSQTTMIVPKDDPSALLKARQALDDDIDSLQRNGSIDGTSAGKGAMRAASDIRGQLDAVLKSDPMIAAGDATFSEHMALKDAVNEGSELFDKGTRLEDFQRSLASKSPQEVEALRQGALSAIWDKLGQATRGELAGAQSMFAKASNNRAKLDALFPNAGDVFDMLHGEAAMRGTEQRVALNSATAERLAVQNKYNPPNSSGGNGGIAATILGEAAGGGYGAAGAFALRQLYNGAHNAFTEGARARLTQGTAQGLANSGAPLDNFLNQVTRAYYSGPWTNALSNVGNAGANLLIRSQDRTARNALSGP